MSRGRSRLAAKLGLKTPLVDHRLGELLYLEGDCRRLASTPTELVRAGQTAGALRTSCRGGFRCGLVRDQAWER